MDKMKNRTNLMVRPILLLFEYFVLVIVIRFLAHIVLTYKFETSHTTFNIFDYFVCTWVFFKSTRI